MRQRLAMEGALALAMAIVNGELGKAEALAKLPKTHQGFWADYGRAAYLDKAVRDEESRRLAEYQKKREQEIRAREEARELALASQRAETKKAEEDLIAAQAPLRDREFDYAYGGGGLKTFLGSKTLSELQALQQTPHLVPVPEEWGGEVSRVWGSTLRDALRSASLGAAMRQFQESIRLEVTEELLASTFALPDGTRVYWGEATAAQHEERAESLESMAAGTIETAGLHRRAVELIRSSGGENLREAATLGP